MVKFELRRVMHEIASCGGSVFCFKLNSLYSFRITQSQQEMEAIKGEPSRPNRVSSCRIEQSRISDTLLWKYCLSSGVKVEEAAAVHERSLSEGYFHQICRNLDIEVTHNFYVDYGLEQPPFEQRAANLVFLPGIIARRIFKRLKCRSARL